MKRLLFGSRRSSPAALLTRISVVFYGAMTAVAVGLMAWRGDLGLMAPAAESWWIGKGAPGDVPGLIGLGLLLAFLVVWITRLPAVGEASWGSFLEERMQEAMAGLKPRHAVLLALLSGFGEEMLFRGVLQIWLVDHLGATGGWVLASLVFGAVHTGSDRRFLLWMGFSAVVGLLLGGLLIVTGSLIAPISLHAGVNGLNLLVQAWEERMQARSVSRR